MSGFRKIFNRITGRSNDQPKQLLSGENGNLFHTLILAYIRIFRKIQESKTRVE